MKERLDKVLAEKIKETIHHSVVPYRDGAWENFLAKKKKKKRRVLYWNLTGAASSLLIFVLLNFLFRGNPSVPNEEGPPQLIQGTKEIDPSWPEKLDRTPQTELAKIQEGHKEQDANDSMKKSNDVELTKKNHLLAKVSVQKSGIKIASYPISSVLDGNVLAKDSPELLSNAEEIEALTPEKDEKKKQDLMYALHFATSMGTTNPTSGNGKSKHYGAGVLVDVPIKSGFSVNSGILFNTFQLSNETTMASLMEGAEAAQTNTYSETDQYNLDIPLNLVYNLPGKKNSFYVLSGLSSYITLKEQRELTTETIREIVIYREVDGVLESFTETESVISSSSSKETGGKFLGFATVNLSIGYRANLGNKVNYEIQPFYKIPLHALISEDIKIPMAGVALKVVFTK